MYKKHNLASKEHIEKLRKRMTGKNNPMYGVHRFRENSPNWKGGISYKKDYKKKMNKKWCLKNKDRKNQLLKQWRHKKGISKRYREECLGGISNTKEYKKLYHKQYKALIKGAGKLTIQTIQQVYEDNIKKYGTLTCYLCLKLIQFGQDSLEHKIPLSRGGMNNYNNLAIAHMSCNRKKHNKTEVEYRRENINV